MGHCVYVLVTGLLNWYLMIITSLAPPILVIVHYAGAMKLYMYNYVWSQEFHVHVYKTGSD